MFPDQIYTRAWAERERKKLGNCDPGLLEKCVRALTLLGHLAESELPFLFKGGTCILLHLPDIRRLSIDIDIVSPASDAELDRVVARIRETAPFTRSEENIRGTAFGREPLPNRRHFKFWFPSERSQTGEDFVLLDVVQEAHCPHDTVTLPIRTSFLEPDREIPVTLPSIESLLGDKLTAFASTTTGVRLRRPSSEPGEVMQVAKQLFDVAILFEHANDFAAVARAYNAVQAQESSYRDDRFSREDSLSDTLNTCLGLTSYQVRQALADIFTDTPLLLDGFKRPRGRLTKNPPDSNALRTIAARAGMLAACLRANQTIDLSVARSSQSPEQIEALQKAKLTDHPCAWLDRIKATNPEAYHYWYLGLAGLNQ